MKDFITAVVKAKKNLALPEIEYHQHVKLTDEKGNMAFKFTVPRKRTS